LAEHKLTCNPQKSAFFQREVEFCGHILREGIRRPAPGKLLPIQRWALPRTITELRGFLGLTNYFSEYVPHYAEDAAPLMEKLKVNRLDGKKGSKKPVEWGEGDVKAFESLKARLAEALSLFQPDVGRPFTLKCDASEHAIGAALMQEFDGVLRPVAFFSRKLAKNQLNWAVKEKEMYAVVAALRKFSGLINFQPVVVETDHRALEHWVSEHVDTPSGPRGRRGRWHEILSQFDLEMRYVPGKANEMADAMSRWAYPATSARGDVSWHGNVEAHREVQEAIQREAEERRQVAVIRGGEVYWCLAEEEEALEERGVGDPRGTWWVRPLEGVGGAPRRFEFKTARERRQQGEPPRHPQERGVEDTATGSGTLGRTEPGEAMPAAIPGDLDGVEPEIARERVEEAVSSTSRPRFRFAPRPPTPGGSGDTFVLDDDWTAPYERSGAFGGAWTACHDANGEWERGYQIAQDKLYHHGLLCVPEELAERVLMAHHVMVGHPGAKRLKIEVGRRYRFPDGIGVEEIINRQRRGCLICQACDPPNQSLDRPVRMSPVIEGFMSSVCLDVFSMTEVEWQGATVDCILVCVDRATGWIIARPTKYAGLTGERAAHLMLDTAWGEIGVPAVVTSDQGAQFVSSWWKAMCARLGIRQAFSQAHRPQANGRAETAGKTIRGVLRKLHTEFSLNWAEALPRVLRIHHDLPNPDHGFSPYELVFGRERSVAGIPSRLSRRCPGAEEFFEHMGRVDEIATGVLREELRKEEERLNRHRKDAVEYQRDEWVWLHRPTALGGAKMQTSWMGPYRVVQRVGEHSYVISMGGRVEQEVHVDQLKPCVTEVTSASLYPMVYRRGDPLSQLPESRIKRILGYRYGDEGIELQVEWEGFEVQEETWVPAAQLGGAIEQVVRLLGRGKERVVSTQ
jgi:transposase InsO family protein